MRQGNSNKRMRGRGGGSGGNGNNIGRKGPNPLSRTYESTGPDVKIRGTALHIAEKYVTLARDAQSSGDPVLAENYLQHAEHYYRIIAAAQATMPQPVAIVRSDIQDDDEEEFESFGETRVEPRVEARPEPRPMVGEDGFMPADAPQPFVDDLGGESRSERPRQDRPQGERRNRFLRGRGDGPRTDRFDGNRPERVERPERGDRPERTERPERVERSERPERPERGERPESTRGPRERPVRVAPAETGEREPSGGDLDQLPAFLMAAPARPAPVPAPTPAPAPAPVEAEATGEESETPRRRTRGGRGRGRRAEYEAGEGAAPEAAAPTAPVAVEE